MVLCPVIVVLGNSLKVVEGIVGACWNFVRSQRILMDDLHIMLLHLFNFFSLEARARIVDNDGVSSIVIHVLMRFLVLLVLGHRHGHGHMHGLVLAMIMNVIVFQMLMLIMLL